MANRPQKLSKGQSEEVVSIIRRKLLAWVSIGLVLLTGVTGLSLWGIKCKVEAQMEATIAKQFGEPQIQQTLEQVASTEASNVIRAQIQPEINKFKDEVAVRIREMEILLANMKDLKRNSQEQQQAIEAIHRTLKNILEESQKIKTRLVGLNSDILKMQKLIATIQYYEVKGRNIFPNPYQKEIVAAMNQLLVTAIPNPQERKRFIDELGGPEL